MCATCGCGEPDNGVTIKMPNEEELVGEHHHHHHHEHGHEHGHEHSHEGGGHHHHHHHSHSKSREISLEEDVLNRNNLLAQRNRGYLEAKNIVAINLVSSPGSGKTTLLETSIEMMKENRKVYVIEGDQQTMNDALRIEKTGAPVVQINTGNGCHLDSDMVNKAIKKLSPEDGSLLFIENVGNLVCPSLFDLGETRRVVIMSITEGDDKPIKYPTMFESADLCLINKIDLKAYLDSDTEKIKEYAMRVNHHLEFIEISAKTGEGLDKWIEWLNKIN